MSRENDFRSFAKKIAIVFYHQGIKALEEEESRNRDGDKRRTKVKGFHLPYASGTQRLSKESLSRLARSYQKVTKEHGKLKPSYQISTDLLFKSRSLASDYGELFKIALLAHRYCMRQDLHLLKFKQLFLEHGLSVKQVMNWHLPDAMVSKEHLDKWMAHLEAFNEEIESDRKITPIEEDIQSNPHDLYESFKQRRREIFPR